MLHHQAQVSGRNFVFYGGMGYTEPAYRTNKLAFNLLKNAHDWSMENSGILGFVVCAVTKNTLWPDSLIFNF
jgi:hypothetical protein